MAGFCVVTMINITEVLKQGMDAFTANDMACLRGRP